MNSSRGPAPVHGLHVLQASSPPPGPPITDEMDTDQQPEDSASGEDLGDDHEDDTEEDEDEEGDSEEGEAAVNMEPILDA